MDKVFKDNPKLESYHETSDGVKFFTKQNARAHAQGLKDKKVKQVERTEGGSQKPEEGEKTADKNATNPMLAAKLRADAINELETVEEVEKALEGETAKSVKKAGAERIASIQATDALSSEENENVQNS